MIAEKKMKSRLSMHVREILLGTIFCGLEMFRGTVALSRNHVIDVPQDFLQIPRVSPTIPLKYIVVSSCSRSRWYTQKV